MSKFKFKEDELQLLANFSQINQNIVILPNRLQVISESNSVVGVYPFKHTGYDFNEIGIYDLNDFRAVLNAFKNPDIEVVPEQYVIISEGNSKVRYGIHPKDMCLSPSKEKRIGFYHDGNLKKADEMVSTIDFVLSQEKLAMLTKMASVLRPKGGAEDMNLYFKSEEAGLRIILATSLSNSNNDFDILLTEDVAVNNLAGDVISVKMSELKLISSDYKVKIKVNKEKNSIQSCWKSSLDVYYFIVMNLVE